MDGETAEARAARDRLRWQCRRGMLELDLLLGAFVEQAGDALDEETRAALLRLLKEPDQTLQGWLFGDERPMEGDLADVIERIRATRLS